MDYRIIPMSADHITQVSEIEKICFAHPWTYDNLLTQANTETSHFLVAESDDKVLGYIGVQEFCGEAYITNVAVLPEYRRCGAGRALVGTAVCNSEKRDCEFITLEVRESNEPAKALYASAGFEYVGKRPDFYTDPAEDALLMTKFFKKV